MALLVHVACCGGGTDNHVTCLNIIAKPDNAVRHAVSFLDGRFGMGGQHPFSRAALSEDRRPESRRDRARLEGRHWSAPAGSLDLRTSSGSMPRCRSLLVGSRKQRPGKRGYLVVFPGVPKLPRKTSIHYRDADRGIQKRKLPAPQPRSLC